MTKTDIVGSGKTQEEAERDVLDSIAIVEEYKKNNANLTRRDHQSSYLDRQVGHKDTQS